MGSFDASHLSDTRIILESVGAEFFSGDAPRAAAGPPVAAIPTPVRPGGAQALRGRGGAAPREEGVGVGAALEHLEREAARRVARDVAVHQPGARVVGAEGDDQEAVAREEGDVAPRRVVELQVQGVGGEAPAFGLLKDDKVVTVEMHLARRC